MPVASHAFSSSVYVLLEGTLATGDKKVAAVGVHDLAVPKDNPGFFARIPKDLLMLKGEGKESRGTHVRDVQGYRKDPNPKPTLNPFHPSPKSEGARASA